VKKPLKKAVKKKADNGLNWEAEAGGSEQVKPLVLNVIVNNGKVVVFQDIITGFCYGLRGDFSLALLGEEQGGPTYFNEEQEEE